MKVTEHLKTAKETLFSFEILPPLKGKSIHSIYDGIDPLMEFKPKFVNVTYHREEFIYKERDNGLLEKIAIRKRPGTVGICAAIMNKYHVDAVPHLICGGFSKEETENALIDLQFLGIDNVLALRGDSIKTEATFKPHKEGHKYAVDLIHQISDMNSGNYMMDDIQLEPTDFCIGAAGYPEKHFEAMNLTTDMHYLKAKVDAGAEYVVTQMFFDNQKYFDFVDSCRAIGITVPIIPGLKPIKTLEHITFLPKFFKIDYPEALSKELLKCKDNKEVEALGIEWGIQQSKELKERNAPCIHYYTMSNSSMVKAIAKEIF
ncbi:MAG: methylenetetrahydrofolate reductase [NAD(P)H] [Crocinitomicaceae bacterium]|jgi:methylenetetrahydrofolate reductase (NADPH)|nr:methylenetetrahydrofolate reductase [NAD(P)H] [Crocinitomicaceae bacterium]MCF8433132.1 methylenetetrahydrofolate reductase [NAD(P)H] [Crocinitomicaceae bacterium]MDP4684369.1 methylenetetrahydrofolate reductase [NAD(P)H] [Crocinitomicaceae bacterium]MDP4866705.1 methylenetetrahydrofolate reductase [NAD(P)H] [Crocinitomicaceae bacterium]MDP5011823.1 methylenetetrahydrofolate reductase [NAD(P)H] [Crocinitomicaceae bacterium]